MKRIISPVVTLFFFAFLSEANAQCCGNNGGCGDMFKNGGIYFSYSTSKLSEPVSDIKETMDAFNALNPNYSKPYSFNQNGRGIHGGLYYYIDKDRRTFLNIGYTNKHYISKAEGDVGGVLNQRLLKCRIGTFDMGLSYLPAKFIKIGLEFNGGLFGAYKKAGEKKNIDDDKYEKYYSDQGFLFGITPHAGIRIKMGMLSLFVTPYYQITLPVITHFDSNNDGTIDDSDTRYSNKLSNYGVNFSLNLFIGGIQEKN